ncbi:MAG: TolC family protein [Pseudomonadota bacterium]
MPIRFHARRCLAGVFLSLIPAGAFAAQPLTLSALEARLREAPPPMVAAASARARALEEDAAVSRTLPPPQLLLGVEDMPVAGNSAWQLPPGGEGMATVGVMQMFPSGVRRELRSRQTLLFADAATAQRDAELRASLRELRLAWIDGWLAQQGLALHERLAVERERLGEARDAAYRAGKVTLAEREQSKLALALLHDRRRELRQQTGAAKQQLARWTGEALPEDTMLAAPDLAPPPEASELLAALDTHPDLIGIRREQEARQTGAELARAGARPDWRLEARYGLRGDMPDTASVMLGVDMPLLSASRRRHEVASALLAGEEGAAQREDTQRRLHADIRTLSQKHQALLERLSALDADVLPLALRASDAALAGYRSGRDDFATVIEARLAALEIEDMRLGLQAELQRTRAELLYFAPVAASGE